MTQEPFRDTYNPGEDHVLDGVLMNKYAKALNALTTQSQEPSFRMPPAIVGVAVITDASNTCPPSSEPYEIAEPPCNSQNLYEAKFRYYDIDQTKWLEFDEPLRLDANAYWELTDTDASSSPTTGEGLPGSSPFGQIPIYRKGDVVVCFWDEQRGWLVPISPPFSDVPAAEFFSGASESIPKATETPNQVDVYLETLAPGGSWTSREKLTFRMPTGDNSSWQDTRSGFALFKAVDGTQFRLRAVNTSDDTVTCVGKRIHFAGAGRFGSDNSVLERTVASYAGGTTLQTTWEATASIAGRYLDSPKIAEDAGVFTILYFDTLDAWIICVAFEVCISGSTTSTTTGDVVKLIEITDSDGTILSTDDYDLVDDTAVDCLYRGRIIEHDPDNADTCVRANVDDGADVWLEIRFSPWVAPRTQMLIGDTIKARKINDSHVNGVLDFPLYEGTWKESEVYGIEAVSGPTWSGTKLANLYAPDDIGGTLLEANVEITDDADLWDNVVIPGDNTERGMVIKVGDLLIPLNVSRRSQVIDFTLPAGGANAMHALSSTAATSTTANASEAPYNSHIDPGGVSNSGRFALQDGGSGLAIRRGSTGTYEVIWVNRSSPMLIEMDGADGAGLASVQDAGGTFLCIWSGANVTPNAVSPGGLCGSDNIFVTEDPVWFSFAGPDNQDPNTADPTYPHFMTSGDKHLAYDTGRSHDAPDNGTRRLYESPQDTQTYYGKAYENWTNASPVAYVRVHPCDDLNGSNEELNVSHTVYIPRNAQRDPNVVDNDVIAYRKAMDNLWVIVAPDGLDAKIGTKTDWVLSSGAIPPGWVVMDGVSNASGSGINALNRFAKFGASAGTTGGENEHSHEMTLVIDKHTISTGNTSHSHFFSVEIAPHPIADLKHSHVIGTTPATVEDSTGSGPVPDACVGLPTQTNATGSTDCTAAPNWGPLLHQPYANVTGESGFFLELDHDYEYNIDPASSEPRFVTIIPIERIDNSV